MKKPFTAVLLLLTIYAQGQIGIGTTTPHSTLDVRGSVSAKFTSFSASTTATSADNMLVFTGTSAATLTLPSAAACQGRIYWIKNSSSNSSTLTIATASSQTIDGIGSWPLTQTNKAVRLVSSGANWFVTSESLPGAIAGTAWIYGGNNVATIQNIGTTSNFSLPFITNNTEKMRLTTDGSLGIGTSAFNATYIERLLVDAGATGNTNYQNVIVGKGNTNSYAQLNIQNSNIGTGASSDVVATADNGNESINYIDMGINSSGNSAAGILGGINTAYLYSTGNDFSIGNGTTAKSLNFFTTTAGTYTERMRIDGAGNVGIGVTNPSYKLHVSGTNPLFLNGVQTGASTDSLLTIINGVVRKLHPSALVVSSSNAWALIGNNSTNPTTNFIGTIDAQPLVIRENNTQVGRFEANSIAFGNGATVNTATHSYALGSSATIASGRTNAVAIGRGATVSVDNAFAIGNGATVGGNNAVALGNTATVGSVANSTALGAATSVTGANSTAVGYNTSVTQSNAVILGDRANASLAVGIGSESFSGTNREKLLVDAGASGSTNFQNVIVGKGNTDSYAQLNIQNLNTGAAASSDVVATANNGSETVNFIDMGINGGGNTSTGVLGGANTAYLYTTGNDFAIGNGSNTRNLNFFTTTGGTYTERMRITSAGNIGIANTAPSEKLDITGNVRFSGALMPNNSAGTAGYVLVSSGAGIAPSWQDGSGYVATTAWVQGGNTYSAIKSIGTISNHDIPFITNNTEKMRIASTGTVGIGTSAFSAANPERLIVNAGTPAVSTDYQNVIVGKGNTNSYAQLNIQNTNAGIAASSDVVATANNGNESVNFIDMGVNGGSNTSTGVLGGANTAYLYSTGNDFVIGNSTTGKDLSLYTTTGGTSTERMRILSTGNVGINVAAPNSTVDVNGSTGAAIILTGANIILDGTHSTVILSNGSTPTVTLPAAAAGNARRIYIIVNQTSGARTISSYRNFLNAGVTTIAAASSITIQSDGANWYQIR